MNKMGRYFTVQGDINIEKLVDCSIFKDKADMYRIAAVNQGISLEDVEDTEYYYRYDPLIACWLEFDTRGARVKNELLDSMMIEEYLSTAC